MKMFRSTTKTLDNLRLKRSDSTPTFSQNKSYGGARSSSPVTLLTTSRLMESSPSSTASPIITTLPQSNVNRFSLDENKIHNNVTRANTVGGVGTSEVDNNNTVDTSGAAHHELTIAGHAPPPPRGPSPLSSSVTSTPRRTADLHHQSSLTDDQHIGATPSPRHSPAYDHKRENDGLGDENMLKSISSEEEIGQAATTTTPTSQHSANSGGGLSHSSSGGQLPLARPSLSVIGSRDSNLDSLGATSIAYANGTAASAVLRNIPAIRSNSSTSSLFPIANANNIASNIANNNNNNKEDRKERRISGSERYRPRRGAMVSCENLLTDSNELFGSLPESTLKNLKSSSKKIYRSGGIFSNPFKNDAEKMEQLNELLRHYQESGIPAAKHYGAGMQYGTGHKFNHLRASSLSVGGGLPPGGPSGHSISPTTTLNSYPGGARAQNSLSSQSARTSLSTTDLQHLQLSTHQPSTLETTTTASGLGGPPPSGPSMQSSSFDAPYDTNYYLESEWRLIVDNPDQLSSREQSQNEAIWEILQTEVFYIRRLKVINDVFISCLLNLQSECLLTEIELKSVFSNITEVFDANHFFWVNYLLPMLNYSRETKSPLNCLMMEEGFLKFDQIFRPYIEYCLEHTGCLQYLKEKRKANVLFKTYILWCENHKDCTRLKLMDLLVEPMQRLTKYSLLLKAVLKKTDNEQHREALARMEAHVGHFVTEVNTAMHRQQEHDKLAAVVNRIECYDAFDCNNDEAEKFLKDYLLLDLMQSMPGCASPKIRHLYFEESVKLKDTQSNKIDVHCFLFTDVLLVCKQISKKSADSRMKVIRQPFLTDRIVPRELKDSSSALLLIYLNEFNVASTYLLLYTSDTKTWVERIRKAQEDYRNAKYCTSDQMFTYQATFDDEMEGYDPHAGQAGLMLAATRSSSRSSLVHSHSGSQDTSDQQQACGSYPNAMVITNNNNSLSIQQQPPRAVSFELGDLRNPSLVVEDADSFARSQSMDNRSPVVTITSPRPERRAFLLRNNGKNGSSSNVSSAGSSPSNSATYLNQNSLSVAVPPQPTARTGRRTGNVEHQQSVPIVTTNMPPQQPHYSSTIQVSVHPPNMTTTSASLPLPLSTQPPPPPPPPPPSLPPKRMLAQRSNSRPLPPLPSSSPPTSTNTSPSLMSISSRSQPCSMTMTINKPPLVKTKNVSCGVASISYAGEKLPGYVESVYDDVGDNANDTSTSATASDEETITTKFVGEENDGEDYQNQQRYNQQQQKRTCRPDRRYHTADSIEHLRKEKDSSIHKRLSWNYGQQQQELSALHQHHHIGCPYHDHEAAVGGADGGSGHRLLHPRPLTAAQRTNKCLSSDSVYSSSGFSSTSSVPLSVGSVDTNNELTCTCGCAYSSRGMPSVTVAGGVVDSTKFNEEDEEGSCGDNIGKSVLNISDRGDSALPVSPALGQPSSGFYHAYSNSQCSTESGTSMPDNETGVGDGSAHMATPILSADKVPKSDIKINVSEIKDGISSVQITLSGGPNTVTRPSKADLKKMKDFLLSNCNVESSEV